MQWFPVNCELQLKKSSMQTQLWEGYFQLIC